MHITRRRLLAATALLPVAACVGMSQSDASQAIADANAAVDTLANIAAILAPATAAKLAPYVEAARKLIAGIGSALTDAAKAGVLNTVMDVLDDALDVLATAPGVPANLQQTIQAIHAIMPLIEAFVRRFVPASAKARVRMPASSMAPDAARKILRTKP